MDTDIQTMRHRPRLNPFAFPSDTDFRFVILIVSAITASLFIYVYLYITIPANSQFVRTMEAYCIITSFKEADAAFPGDGPAHQPVFYQRCITPTDRDEAIWIGLSLALLFSVAGAIYYAFPAWKIWRDGLVPLHAKNTPPQMVDYLTHLCREAGLSRFPVFLLNPYRSESSGVTFGRLGRYYVVLNRGLVTQFQRDQALFRAIVLHEFGHLRNADVDKTYFTLAIGWAFGIAALLPWAIIQFLPPWHFDQFFDLDWRILLLSALVYLTRNAVLRAREVYADVRASIWEGSQGALSRVLNSLPSLRGPLYRPLQKHPDPKIRYELLDDTSRLFQQNFWEAFAIGIVVTDILTGFDWFLGILHVGTDVIGPVEVGILFAPLLVGVVGLGVWRSTFASRMRGITSPNILPASLGLTLGLLLGQPLSILTSLTGSGYFIDITPSSLGNSTQIPLLNWIGLIILWSILLLILLFFLLRWIMIGATSWLDVAARASSPRRIYLIALVVASVVTGIYLGLFVVVRDFVTAVVQGDISPSGLPITTPGLAALLNLDTKSPLIALIISVLTINPFTSIALVCLWAYPLASWLWGHHTTTLTEARWAFLDLFPRQLTLPPLAPLRPGLALGVGLTGSLVFYILLSFFIKVLQMEVSQDEQLALAVLLQGGIAAIVAAWTRRLGGLHALFAASIAAYFMTLGILVFNMLSGAIIDFNFVKKVFYIIVNQGALVALLVGCAVAVLAKWGRSLGRRHVQGNVT